MAPVARDPGGRVPLMKLHVEQPEVSLEIPVQKRRQAMVYPSDARGCLINSALTGDEDMYVSGRNYRPGELVRISVVPNQRDWYIGDPINDVTGAGAAAAPFVRADKQGRFTLRVWDRSLQRRGTYDIIAERFGDEESASANRIDADTIISYASDTGYILYLRYPPGGPLMDIAGRPVSGSPYFQYADSFAKDNDPVWGAVDPTYVSTTHPGGRYAAYYVVAHRDANGWDPAAGGATNLVDVSGGVEIKPVKSGCINGTDFIIWPSALMTTGRYDVVVNFGSTPAETDTQFTDDTNYDSAIDFLDGADQIGFVVAEDPYERGSYPVGEAAYSTDDFLQNFGTAFDDVDLRAVVRYPATVAGENRPVAAGQHPLFIIEHGNHAHCEMCKDSAGNPAPCSSLTGLTCADLYDRASCPQRVLNHEGYMELLNILASHGVIAVSIDAYDLTGWNCPGLTSAWIQERGDLILKHLELWSHLNDPTSYTSYTDYFSNRFNNHVDMTKISVSGHSRGGEASVAAYIRNTVFNIGSVSSIAPVDFINYTLPDVPYFVILPAADGDVSGLSGARIYDRAGQGTVPDDATVKSGIHVYGANHNFFNTVWADDGDESWTPRDDYIPKDQQQKIGEAYLAAFARVHLLGEAPYEDMFRGRLVFLSTAGFKIHHARHEKLHSRLDDGSGNGMPSSGVAVTTVSGPSVHVSDAAKIVWSSGPSREYVYTVPSGKRNVTAYEVFSFRAAQTSSSTNPASGSQQFQVELEGGGNTKAVYTGRFDEIPKPYNRSGSAHNVMTTVRIPLHSFIMNRSGVTLNDIDTVRFKFTYPNQGEIYVDDVEFSR